MAVEHYTTTAEDIELQFGANHVGHFLLTNLLIPIMSQGSRIINVFSFGYMSGGVRYDD
jgi:NAD(P)-dependent dehydrogenase (short-subunit alcohol dehydrogenase family)